MATAEIGGVERGGYMMTGLRGAAEAETFAALATSRTDAIRLLRDGAAAVTAAGCAGALNVWRVDGFWRCERYAYCVTQASEDCESLAAVARWLAVEWPEIGDRETLASIFA